MRFKRGRKVEVFSQNEVPSGSWRCAEIACGNGHAYTVKYYGNLDAYGEAEEVFERVSRKAIRPCPPLMQVPENWSPGDLVEVFHYFSWKTATVLKILSRNQVLVRLLGTSQELKVGKLDIRVRLCWQGDEWIVIGKSCGNSEESRPNLPSTGKFNHNSGLKDATANLYFKDGRFATRNVNNFQEPDIIPSGKLKRRSPYCSQIGEYGPRNKIRVYEKEPRRLIFFVQPVLPKKVDDVASSRQLLDEKCIHPSFNNRLTGCFESNSVRETTNGAVGCSGPHWEALTSCFQMSKDATQICSIHHLYLGVSMGHCCLQTCFEYRQAWLAVGILRLQLLHFPIWACHGALNV